MQNPDKIVATTILIVLLLCAYAVSGAQACVDCDLNKDAFKKTSTIKLETGKILWIKNHGIPLKSKMKIFDDRIFLMNHSY